MFERAVRRLVVLAVGILLCGLLPVAALALPVSHDADGDGWLDGLETQLGSDPADASKTLESFAAPPTCLDGLDNDGDGQTDLDDGGCTPPALPTDTFPAAGTDVFDSHLTLDGYPLPYAGATCQVDFDAHGPTVVRRSEPVDPGDGRRVIDTEMLAMQLTGTATILEGGGCPLPAGDFEVAMVESPTQASTGQVKASGAGADFPADSFFDVFFEIATPAGIIPGGAPGGQPGGAVRVSNLIGGLPPFHSKKNPNCYVVAGLPHEHCPKAPPDHFKCYRGRFPKFERRKVTLRDQFGEEEARVLRPVYLCTPASKNAEPLYDETAHLKCYALKPVKKKQAVVVRNQLGTANVTTKHSSLLCLPSNKNDEGDPLELDHFKCYTAKFPKFTRRPVTLVDQFKTEQTQVLRPLHLCNPVSKNGEGIRNPLEHLVCYRIKPQRERQAVAVKNQFGEEQVKVLASELLCVPSSKTESTGTTTTTIVSQTTTTTSSTTSTTFCTTGCTGRGIVFARQTGPIETGTAICMSEIQGGCVATGPECATPHLHQTIQVIGIGGPFADMDPTGCGHGAVEMGHNCGPDSVPACQ